MERKIRTIIEQIPKYRKFNGRRNQKRRKNIKYGVKFKNKITNIVIYILYIALSTSKLILRGKQINYSCIFRLFFSLICKS